MRRREIRVRANRGTPACHGIRRDCASISCLSPAPRDVEKRASSVAPLAILCRLDVPTFFQRLADLLLSQMFLFRPIFIDAVRLPVLGDKLRWFHVLGFPIKVEYLIFRSKKILGVAMAFQTPLHAMWLVDINSRHVIDRTVATET